MTPSRTECGYALSFLTTPGVGTGTLRILSQNFASWEDAAHADYTTLHTCGIAERALKALTTRKQHADFATLCDPYDAQEITIVLSSDDRYPHLLKQIADAPPILFVRGNVHALTASRMIAVVGSRAATAYGNRVTETLCLQAAHAGISIVSGLALGIDGIAHRAALAANAPTVAVLGNSVEDAYIAPRTHYDLAHAIIADGGALCSEYPLGTRATTYTFPQRNRIMAGMTHGTLVVEAAAQSGTVITARYAIEYGREVFAVPGSIFDNTHAGTHALIRDGATLVRGIADIIAELPLDQTQQNVTTSSQHDLQTKETDFASYTQQQQRLLRLLATEPKTVDELIAASKTSTTEVLADLSLLEIYGMVKKISGNTYSILRRL